MSSTASIAPPLAERNGRVVQGHWLLARLGKRVLRPGGIELTRALLTAARPSGADVVELAPGLGRTAGEIVAMGPRSYVGVDATQDAVRAVQEIVGARGSVHLGDAARTRLPDASADVVIGEAMLTMQSARTKAAIVAEAARLLRPGGRYAIHELALNPDAAAGTEIRRVLARTMRVNARPLTVAEWWALLESHGLVVDRVETAPVALLEPRRLVADEGLLGALRFGRNLLADTTARRRVLAMRRVFREHRNHLVAIGLVASRPAAPSSSGSRSHRSPAHTHPEG